MTVEDPDVVDVAGISDASGEVVLTVSDHLSWHDLQGHSAALEAKLAGYVRFIESGQVLERYPDAHRRGIRIVVAFLHPVPSAAAHVIVAARRGLEARSIAFSHFLLQDPT